MKRNILRTTAWLASASLLGILTCADGQSAGARKQISFQHTDNENQTNGGVAWTSSWTFSGAGAHTLHGFKISEGDVVEWHCPQPFALRARPSTNIDWGSCFPGKPVHGAPFDKNDWVLDATPANGGYVATLPFQKGSLHGTNGERYDIFVLRDVSPVTVSLGETIFAPAGNTNWDTVGATLAWESSIENGQQPTDK